MLEPIYHSEAILGEEADPVAASIEMMAAEADLRDKEAGSSHFAVAHLCPSSLGSLRFQE